MLWIFLGVCFLVLLYLGVPWLHGRFCHFILKRKADSCKAVVLTFDDGPGKYLTPAVLKILAENNAKATFFLLGRNIPGCEDVVAAIAEQGHEICSHGYEHLNYLKISPLRAIGDIKRGWRAIDAALGIRQGKYTFRPPYGKLNLVCLLYLLACRVRVVYWSLDLGDTSVRGPDPQKLAAAIETDNGAVVLAHDFDRRDKTRAQLVLDSVRSVLKAAGRTGKQVLSVSQLLNAG